MSKNALRSKEIFELLRDLGALACWNNKRLDGKNCLDLGQRKMCLPCRAFKLFGKEAKRLDRTTGRAG
jgi:hypothetical protein